MKAIAYRSSRYRDYYHHNGQEAWTNSMGIKVRNPTAHGGHIDTSELMALAPSGCTPLRNHRLAARGERDYKTTGAMGDSSQATATITAINI